MNPPRAIIAELVEAAVFAFVATAAEELAKTAVDALRARLGLERGDDTAVGAPRPRRTM